jgi:hypothetical protein
VIHGFFLPHRGPHPYVRVGVPIPAVNEQWTWIEFVVDTGAATTVIHPDDAVYRLGMSRPDLDASAWPRHSTSAASGVGGRVQFLVTPAAFRFSDVRRGRFHFIEQEVRIAAANPANQYLPSLLGWDLLRHFELVVSGPNRTVTLDLPTR